MSRDWQFLVKAFEEAFPDGQRRRVAYAEVVGGGWLTILVDADTDADLYDAQQRFIWFANRLWNRNGATEDEYSTYLVRVADLLRSHFGD